MAAQDKNYTFQPFGRFAFRAPLCPLSKVGELPACGTGADYTALRSGTEEVLRKHFSDPVNDEALFIASPSLHQSFKKWAAGEIKKDKERDKVLLGLLKYYGRMAYRCTPFGLFAGIAVGQFADESRIELKPRENHKRDIRLDMEYICALAAEIQKQDAVKAQLLYYPNSSSYIVGDKLRYVEARFKDKARTHHLVNVDFSPYLEKLLKKAAGGASAADLSACLVDDEITLDDATAFVNEVIESQVVVSHLEPVLTGEDYFSALCKDIGKLKNCEATQSALRQIDTHLKTLRQTPLGLDSSRYQEIVTLLKAQSEEAPDNHLFQVDMLAGTETATLSRYIHKDLKRIFELVSKLSNFPGQTYLKRFATNFYERYEERTVPLAEALDTELGIGYMQDAGKSGGVLPLLDDIAFPSEGGEQPGSWNKLSELRYKLIRRALTERSSVVHITDEDLKDFPPSEILNSGSGAIMTSLLASSPEAIASGDYQIELRSCGSSGAKLLGRFSQASPELESLVNEIADFEDQAESGAINAEIVHLPQSRLGNILIRPKLRQYEIPYLARSCQPAEFQIPINDLFVKVRGQRVILWSKRLGKRIIPRLTSAHNYHAGLPIYHFLCDLEHQDSIPSGSWSWGQLDNVEFLPRVEYGRLILERARWRLNKQELKALVQSKSPEEFFEKLTELRHSRGIPALVSIEMGDNQIPLNLENPLCAELMASEIKEREFYDLREAQASDAQLLIRSPEGQFTNEFVFPFKLVVQQQKDVAPRAKAEDSPPAAGYVKRTFPPGSEWLYAKLYLGSKTADKVLCGVLQPLAEALLSEGWISKWFFIRYADPGNHLRVRFLLTNPDKTEAISRRLNEGLAPWIDANLIHRTVLDTYQREIERYGAGSMELSESLFFHDSQYCCEILSQLHGDSGEALKWRIALLGTDMMLEDFGLTSIEEKLAFCKQSAESYLKEYKLEKEYKYQLNDKYRKEKKVVESLILREGEAFAEILPAYEILKGRSKAFTEICRALSGQRNSEIQGAPLRELLGSYIHMFLNRFQTSQQRQQEAVIYHFMVTCYQSLKARTVL